MTVGVRRLMLTVHVAASVGWMGAAGAFVALTAVGVTSAEEPTVRGAYLVMEPAARFVLLPLAFASLATGIIQSLGTPWGLFRHYWVVFKLVINVFTVIVLLAYLPTFRALAAAAADPSVDLPAVRSVSPGLHGALAVLALFAATALAVYKPRGMTAYGWRKEHEERTRRLTGRTERSDTR